MQTGAELILFLVLIPLVLGQTWERHETLDNDGIMNLYWTPDLESGDITFELHAKTQGWAGLGFSANGAMPGSDIVVGWIKDGQTYFTDRHAVGNELPLVDEIQDYELLFASETEEGLILRFKRLIDTCDENDFYITYHPWVMEGNEEYVHHLTLMTCTVNEGEEEIFEQFLQDYPHGSSCFDPEISFLIGNCQRILMGWAVGGVLFPILWGIAVRASPNDLDPGQQALAQLVGCRASRDKAERRNHSTSYEVYRYIFC
ncbi:unnamed protein product, partial [Darwinula stevensoni]